MLPKTSRRPPSRTRGAECARARKHGPRSEDHDGRAHNLALPRASLAGDGADARRMLLDGGLYVTPNRRGRERFTAFLTAVRSPARVVAASVWGGGQPGSYVRSWRATANGLEGVAVAHCDALLCLDELAQISAREAGEVAYLLANGSGKSRSARDGAARRAARWRVLFLSSGEIGLADKVMEDGKKRLAAGQHVRIVDIAADAGTGLGLFEHLHGFTSADALARYLRSASAPVYGVAAPVFLGSIAG